MFLNGGIDPATNATIIPSAEFDTITSAHSIVIPGEATAQTSTEVYGLAWNRLSVLGHDVSKSCPFTLYLT
jgi:methionine-rich copper-binding protein CopC